MLMVRYRVGIDVGGTFTDFVAVPDDGSRPFRYKVASTPRDPAEAVAAGMTHLLAQLGGAGRIASVTHGTTIGLNAIIQRAGGRVALVVSEGFPDILEIGRSRMPDSFNLHAVNPRPLVSRDHVFEIGARVSPDGAPLGDPDDAEISELAARIVDRAPDAVVLNLLHGYANPEHEQRIAAALAARIEAEGGSAQVIAASVVWPEVREYERTLVAVMGAHIHGTLQRYLASLRQRLADLGVTAPLFISGSNGGTLSIESAVARPLDTVLSGPASGVTAARMHYPGENMITFDMGGTSSDISIVVEGRNQLTTRTEIGGLALMLPVVDVAAIGAGGGSVIWVDAVGEQATLQVGPDSVGASPGPAAYGLGGDRAAITDAYLATGMISSEGFLGGTMRLYPERSTSALEAVADDLGITGEDRAVKAAAAALRMTTAQMTTQLQKRLAEHAADPRDFTIVPFGGAGPTHAPMLAEELGVTRLRIPDAAATYCALGAALAPLRRDFVHSVRSLLSPESVAQIQQAARDILQQGREWLTANGDDCELGSVHVTLDMRYPKQAYELTVDLGTHALVDLVGGAAEAITTAEIERAFNAEHELRYGFVHARHDLSVESLRMAILGSTTPEERRAPASSGPAPLVQPRGHRPLQWLDEWFEAAVFDFEDIAPGSGVTGGSIIEHGDTTIIVPPSWSARRLPNFDLELTREDVS
jgi:N-methylhydantoinase A